jgi:lipoate-protein ligase A
MITEQSNPTTDITKKINPLEDSEEEIDYETAEDDNEEKVSKPEKKKAYRISGGILVLHGTDSTDIQLTTDDKIAFQESMDEFVTEVAEIVDFNKLNVYENNVEWSGKITELDLEFFFSIGESKGVYINGTMIKLDDDFLEFINKLQTYYEKFKSKWSKVIASKKKTPEK